MTPTTQRPLLYLDSADLDSMVTAGDSADRTVKAIFKVLTPSQRKNLAYWLQEAHKEAKRLCTDAEIASFRAGVLSEAKKYEGGGGRVSKQSEPTKSAKPTTADLAGWFGIDEEK